MTPGRPPPVGYRAPPRPSSSSSPAPVSPRRRSRRRRRGRPPSSPQLTGVEMTPPGPADAPAAPGAVAASGPAPNDRDQADGGGRRPARRPRRQLGMRRLPDLSPAPWRRAVRVGAAEATSRAPPGRSTPPSGSIPAAPRPLSPRPPWTASRATGWAGFGRLAAGLRRDSFGQPLERYLWLQELLLWACLLLVTGGLFIAVQMLTKGDGALPGPLRTSSAASCRAACRAGWCRAPAPCLLWPLALPAGAVWLPLYWSVLLWGYASASERAVIVALWLLLGVAPLLVDLQRQQLAVALSPPAQAHGEPRASTASTAACSPTSGCCAPCCRRARRQAPDRRRPPLAQPVGARPRALPPGARGGAEQHHRAPRPRRLLLPQGGLQPAPSRASRRPPPPTRRTPPRQYNLSQAYSESYLFDEQQARPGPGPGDRPRAGQSLDGQAADQRVVTADGGIARIPEIRRELLASWGRARARSAPRLELCAAGSRLLLAAGPACCSPSPSTSRAAPSATPSGRPSLPRQGPFDALGGALCCPASPRRRSARGGRPSSPSWCPPPC